METAEITATKVFPDALTGANFIKLEGMQTQTATGIDDFVANIRKNLKKGYKNIIHLEGFQRVKGHDKLIALIGGGPSIKKELDKIKEFQAKGYETIACGSSHDWLIENGIVPTYCAVCDPDAISTEYLKLKNNKVKYLIAYGCDEKILDHLNGQNIYMWHCHSDEAYGRIKDEVPEYVAISGGCTVGLRSISMAIMFGYTNIHFWGFDSCLGEDEAHHAYEFATEGEKWQIAQIYKVKMGNKEPGDKVYSCIGYQLAQAHHFYSFYASYHYLFTPTFHGEGMLADFMELLNKEGVLSQYSQQRAQMLNTHSIGIQNG